MIDPTRRANTVARKLGIEQSDAKIIKDAIWDAYKKGRDDARKQEASREAHRVIWRSNRIR